MSEWGREGERSTVRDDPYTCTCTHDQVLCQSDNQVILACLHSRDKGDNYVFSQMFSFRGNPPPMLSLSIYIGTESNHLAEDSSGSNGRRLPESLFQPHTLHTMWPGAMLLERVSEDFQGLIISVFLSEKKKKKLQGGRGAIQFVSFAYELKGKWFLFHYLPLKVVWVIKCWLKTKKCFLGEHALWPPRWLRA